MRCVVFAFLALAVARAAPAQTSLPHAFVFDRYMTPAAGAENMASLQHVLSGVEDRWLPSRLWTEQSRAKRALGALYRTGKFLALDVPQDHMLLVTAHEVFGHGARFRELGDGRIKYGFDAPIPYGSGDAFTSFNGRFPISPLAHLNASAAGIEAQSSLADLIGDHAVARGRIHYREAWLYFESRLTGMSYILSASPGSAEGHDPADFLERFEEACRAPCTPLTRRHIQRRALLTLADPLVYYALYAVGGSYIGRGETTGPMPLVPVGSGIRMLPSLGYALAPYGEEWSVRTMLQDGSREERRARRVTNVTLRVGNTGATTTWGASARMADVLQVRTLRFAASMDVWRQPDLLAEQTSAPLKMGAGAAASVVVPLPTFLKSRWSDGLLLTGGYKSQGFVPGEQLSGGFVFRAGITLAERPAQRPAIDP